MRNTIVLTCCLRLIVSLFVIWYIVIIKLITKIRIIGIEYSQYTENNVCYDRLFNVKACCK